MRMLTVPTTGFAIRAEPNELKQVAGFPFLLDFPDIRREYQASELFPLFKNRVIKSGRQDFADYVGNLGLPQEANPIEILTMNGGHRATDTFEVFPKLEQSDQGNFVCRFFLRGSRYVSEAAQQRYKSLLPNDRLHIAVELTNPVTPLAIQFQTQDYHMIGWAPDYLARDLATTLEDSSASYSAHVVRVNPLPTPARHRLLIEMCGPWNDEREPMSSKDFEPLVH